MKCKSIILMLILTASFSTAANAQSPIFELDTSQDYKNQSSLSDSGQYRSKPHIQIAALPDYTVTQSGPYNRISIFRKSDEEMLGSVRLADKVIGAHIEDGIVYLLQNKKSWINQSYYNLTTILSRFELQNMTFIGETEIPISLTCGAKPRNFIHGKIPVQQWFPRRHGGIARKLLFLTVKDVSELTNTTRPKKYCGVRVSSIGQSHFALWDFSDVYHIIDIESETTAFTISGSKDASKLNIVFSDDNVFAQPIYNNYHTNKKETRPISIYDLKSGTKIASVDMPTGDMKIVQGKLLLTIRTPKGVKTSVYNINQDVIRASLNE